MLDLKRDERRACWLSQCVRDEEREADGCLEDGWREGWMEGGRKGGVMMSRPTPSIICAAQPLHSSFHPSREEME